MSILFGVRAADGDFIAESRLRRLAAATDRYLSFIQSSWVVSKLVSSFIFRLAALALVCAGVSTRVTFATP